MRLPRIAVKNHHFTIMIVGVLLAYGIYAFITMPRTEDPQVVIPGVSILITYPGANPKDIEQLVTDPLEKAINELEDIKQIRSYSGNSFGIVSVEFYFNTDAGEKYREVVEKVNGLQADMPAEISEIRYMKYEIASVYILQMALVSDTASYKALRDDAEVLQDRLTRVPGVRQAKIFACPDQQVTVLADMARMSQMNVSLSQLMDAIKYSNINIPGGGIETHARKISINTSGSYQSFKEIENTVVGSAGGSLVYVKDVADVFFGYEDKDYHARFNGRRAIFVAVNQKDGANIYSVKSGIRNELAAFKSELSPGIELHTVFDQSKSVDNRFNGFFFNLLQGIIIVGLVILLGVGLRESAIVMTAVPLSIFFGIGFLNLAGYHLEQISIAGLVIALGMLVDNAIVVTENVSRYLDLGMPRQEAAIKGASEVGWAMVSATATTLCAFIPLMLMPDESGEFIRSMPLTVIFTLSASLLLALTFSPYLGSIVLQKVEDSKKSFFNKKLISFIEGPYQKMLQYCLRKPVRVLMTAGVVFVASLALFTFVGVSFFPKAEKPQFLINIHTPTGANIHETDRAVHFVEEFLSGQDEVLRYASNIGSGNPRIYYNSGNSNEDPNFGQIYVELREQNIEQQKKLITMIRMKSREYAGATIEVKELMQGSPVSAPVSFILVAKSLDDLKMISRDVEKMLNEAPGAINVRNPLGTSRTDVQVLINREKAGILGVPLAVIDRTVRAGIEGLAVSKYRDTEGTEHNIVVHLGRSRHHKISGISEIPHIKVTSLAGRHIELGALANKDNFDSGLAGISHFGLERSVEITADAADGFSVDKIVQNVLVRFDSYTWPKGSRYIISGELESRESSFGGMGVALIIALLAIFGVLVFQFRSFSQPLIIFATIPLAMIGSIIALFVTGNSFSFTAFVGLIALVGIVVNNAIILVDYTNQLRAQGMKLTDALVAASKTRFISIILTTVTTIGGLLPLALQGGSLWAPLGWTISGGLLTSTMLTLLIVPVIYRILAVWKEKHADDLK